ncbi:MAG: hypothetical protein M1833_003057 [Piccolia ochrophora]|nr:MAG: hypothetical protein M1833_003057 [Piccolia ochrophora]
MDALLGKVTQHAMNYAIRSGITITSTYAIGQCSRLLKASNIPSNDRDELLALRDRLEKKIKIISPAIDMIELLSARGNTSLESALTLTRSLRWDFQSLGLQMAKAANAEELARQRNAKSNARSQPVIGLKLILKEVRQLLDRIEDAVPLISLAITTSGAKLSTNLPTTVSPSRLLQASTFLTGGDTQYAMIPGVPAQIGPAFTVSMYMLFSGHSLRRPDDDGVVRGTTWQEVIHKARVKLRRVSLDSTYGLPNHDEQGQNQPRNSSEQADFFGDSSLNGQGQDAPSPEHFAASTRADEFSYQLLIIEDLNDDRVHTFEQDEPQPTSFDDVELAGIREVVPIHEISKIFYADTGKILNIGGEGEPNRPVLLLKRDVNACPPRRMMEKTHGEDNSFYSEYEDHEVESDLSTGSPRETRASDNEQAEKHAHSHSGPWRLPPNLDPEWIAFDVYTEEPDSDSDDESELETEDSSSQPRSSRPREASVEPQLETAFSALNLNTPSSSTSTPSRANNQLTPHTPFHLYASPSLGGPTSGRAGPIKTSLSLLELLIRLTALQQFQQTSHLAITDELLNFFLSESSSTGAGIDGDERRRKRDAARRKVGFDPYDESPVKLRGEAGQQRPPTEMQQFDERGYSWDESAGRSLRWDSRQASASPSPMLLRSRESVERGTPPPPTKSPASTLSSGRYPTPSTPGSGKGRAATLRSRTKGGSANKASPLGRGQSVETDSSLGTSPGYDEGDPVKPE